MQGIEFSRIKLPQVKPMSESLWAQQRHSRNVLDRWRQQNRPGESLYLVLKESRCIQEAAR